MKEYRTAILVGALATLLAWASKGPALLEALRVGEVAVVPVMVLFFSLSFLVLGGVKAYFRRPASLMFALHALLATIAAGFLMHWLFYIPLALSVVVSIAAVALLDTPSEPTR